MTRHRPLDDRPAIPDDNAPVAPAHAPTWWRVRRVRAIAATAVALAVGFSLASAYLSWSTAVDSSRQSAGVEKRLEVLEKDLQERTEQRNAERDQAAARDAETRQQVHDYICELLAQLPASSPSLQRLRATLACGEAGTTATTAPPASSSTPSAAAPAAPSAAANRQAPRPSPAAPTTTTTAPPSSSSAPAGPSPGLLCTTLRICLNGTP